MPASRLFSMGQILQSAYLVAFKSFKGLSRSEIRMDKEAVAATP